MRVPDGPYLTMVEAYRTHYDASPLKIVWEIDSKGNLIGSTMVVKQVATK